MTSTEELIKQNREKLINSIFETEETISTIKDEIDYKEAEIETLEDDIFNMEEELERQSEAVLIVRKQLDELMSKDFSNFSDAQIQEYFFGKDNLTLSLFEDDVALDVI